MNDNTHQNERNRLSSHAFLHVYRNRVMNILAVLFVLLYFAARMNYVISEEKERCYELLSQNMEEAERYENYANEANTLYVSVQDQDYLSGCNLFIAYINSGYDETKCINRLNSISDDYDSVFYLKRDGALISYPDRPTLSLTEEELAQLLRDGSLQRENDSMNYWAIPNGEDTMIVRIDESCANQISMDVLPLLCLDGFVYNNETLDVTEADEVSIPSNLSSMYIGEPMDVPQFADSQTQIRLISPSKNGLAKYTGMKLAAVHPLSYQNKGSSICAYIPVSEIASNVLVKSGLPTFLCLGFISLCIFGSLHFRHVLLKEKRYEDHGKKEKKNRIIRLPFHCYIDVDLTRCILFMQIFMGLLVILCSGLLLALNSFSVSYENAEYNLEQLVETEKSYEKALDECWSAYSSPAIGMAETVNNFYLNKGNITSDEKTQDNLRNMVDSTFIDEISVYDEEGNNVFTTADSVGYPLSMDSSSAQYSFRSLLSGDKEYIITRSDNRDGVIYCAMKRTDAVGVVVLAYSDQGFGKLEEKLSSESILEGFYYSDSCLFVDKESADLNSANTAYRISSDGNKISCTVSDLPALSEKETFCGFRKINNQQFLLVGLGSEDRSIFYFEPMSEITDGLWASIATYTVFLLLVCFLVFLGCGVFTEESIGPEEDAGDAETEIHFSHHLTDRMMKRMTLTDKMENSQKTIWQRGLYSVIMLIGLTLLLELLMNENSMLAFLLGGQWEKGFNLFALTEVLLIVLAACLLFQLLKFFFQELSKSFPLHYITVIQMVHSILNIVIVVTLVICCANELGIDTATILASVGISGLALGIAAKDTINDMLNGLFIIMDGRVQVGDWVQIGDFYGQIVKIGIRTTKVKRYNLEKSINNSSMNNLINLSKGDSCVALKFVVAYDTDLDFLKQLLESSFDRFQEACGGKLWGKVVFLGASDFDTKRMTVTAVIRCEEKDRKSLTTKCTTVLISLLKENGIKVGKTF